MHTYSEMAQLAQMCATNARLASNEEVAAVLWKMAREYQAKAVKLNGGKLSDIGRPPPRLTG